jgi:hypothetical protein
MKSSISAKVIVMVLCAFILVGSVVLYSGIFVDAHDKCDKFCAEKYPSPNMELYFACFNGCLFGVSIL